MSNLPEARRHRLQQLFLSDDFKILREVIAHRIAVKHTDMANQAYRTARTILETGGATEGALNDMRDMARWIVVNDTLDELQREAHSDKPINVGSSISHANLVSP